MSETKRGYEVGRGGGGPLRDPLMRHPSRFAPRIDLHRRRHPGRKDHAFRHLIDVDMHRNALRQAHPGKERIAVGESLPVGLRVCAVDAAGDAKAGIDTFASAFETNEPELMMREFFAAQDRRKGAARSAP